MACANEAGSLGGTTNPVSRCRLIAVVPVAISQQINGLDARAPSKSVMPKASERRWDGKTTARHSENKTFLSASGKAPTK